MKSVFTESKLYSGVGDILYLFQHCALKTSNEAVVEGIGNIVNMHADRRRGLSSDAYEREAFIHYNGPPLCKADGLIKEVLDIHFDEGKPWHFTKGSRGAQSVSAGSKSAVLTRHHGEPSKLPCMV